MSRRILQKAESTPASGKNSPRRWWMSSGTAAAVMAALLVVAAGTVFGVERFPPPDFTSGYTFPTTTAPSPREGWLQVLDVVVLFLSLALSAYLVLVKRLRKYIFAQAVFSIFYFGFYRKGCVCSVGSVQDVTLAMFNNGYAVPWTVLAFFLLPLVFAVFFGRVFCASVCPLGVLQDVVLVKPIPLPLWLEKALGLIPFMFLGAGVLLAATGSIFLFCEYDPFISLYRRSGSYNMLMLGLIFLLAGVIIGRPYCRFLCPYGALLNIISRFSWRKVTLTPQDCVHCQLCDVACPFGAIAEPAGIPSEPVLRKRRRWLVAAIALVPILVIAGGWLGAQISGPMSRLNARVALAWQLASEDTGRALVATEASQAFRNSGRPVKELYAEAARIRSQFKLGGWLWGGFVGLAAGLQLVGLARTKHRDVFEPDPATCVSCGRCYTHCPNEIIRLKREQRARAIPLKLVKN